MGRNDIQPDVLRAALDKLPDVFTTKDVSEQPAVRDAHPAEASHSHYHAFVGGALSDHRSWLGIDEIAKATARGSRWRKTVAARPLPGRPRAADAPSPAPTAAPTDLGFGPQVPSDNALVARLRWHQSWYRSEVLRLPCGTGPNAGSARALGSMLTVEDGAAGRNFLTPAIAELARRRVAEGTGVVEPFRLFHNLLSSQPMCFNLFGPLAADLDLATRLLQAMLPDVREVTRVALEWSPTPPAEYLNDRTAFDAFIEYRDADDRLCAIGVETKLSEPFSQAVYDGEPYRRWMRQPDAPWRSPTEERTGDPRWNQLWRDHLLAIAVRDHARSPYADARLLVVHHPTDTACVAALAGYRALLRPNDDSLVALPLDQLLDAWAGAPNPPEVRRWLDDFRVRYLDLWRSEDGWKAARSLGAAR